MKKHSMILAILALALGLWPAWTAYAASPSKNVLQVAGYTFDPSAFEINARPELLLKNQPAPGLEITSGRFIVQLKQNLTKAISTELRQKFEFKLQYFVPQRGYIETITTAQIEAVTSHSAIRAIVPYHPAFKLSPTIGNFKPRSEERQTTSAMRIRVVLFDDADVEQVKDALGALRIENADAVDDRSSNGVVRIRFTLPSVNLLTQIAQIPSIRWIEEIGELDEDNANAATTNQSGSAGLSPIWDQGLTGAGQTIGMIDTRLPDIDHCFFEDPINNTPGATHRKIDALRDSVGVGRGKHATFVAGNFAGDDFNNLGTHRRRGAAWSVRVVAGVVRDVGLNTLLAELQAARDSGATIHTNSWHDNTAGPGNAAEYNQNAADVDSFVYNNEEHIVLGSGGNTGEEQGPPGTAKNAIAVNAAQADPNESSLGDGNPGPTADGRRKPDLVGVGCAIASSISGTNCRARTYWPSGTVCATSFATPHVAAMAALTRQYFTTGRYPSGTATPQDELTPSGALIKAVLINSSIDMTNVPGYPSLREGWGILRLDDALAFAGDARRLAVWDRLHVDGTSTGVVSNFTVNVDNDTEPLRVVLVWSDPPALAGANPALINDLDLRVTSPYGTQTYLGNVFTNGISSTGGTADNVNNVEVIHIARPQVGTWTIDVEGVAINIGNPDQGYALAATAAFAP